MNINWYVRLFLGPNKIKYHEKLPPRAHTFPHKHLNDKNIHNIKLSIQTTRTYVRKSIKCISSAFISCICSPSNSSKITTTTTTTTNWTVHSYSSNRENSISRHIFEYTQPKRVFKILCILRCVWLQKKI